MEARRRPEVRLHITCPNCETPAKGYKTRKLSSVVTEVAYNCTNPACGSSFVSIVEVARWLRMPSFINPQVNVPLSPFVQRSQIAEALATMRVAALPPEGEMISANDASRQLGMFDQPFQMATAAGP
ncbi:MAG: hypothetical protein EOP50_03540 [Sphingobacteriales bacterium]|nr:MAG: hypothetical protein EOP50_03540 [Sphingobacteriales bacterium]